LRKRVAKAAATAGNLASTGAQLGTHTGTIALVTGAAGASATGIGLVVAGGALTLGTSIFAARSAYKTSGHQRVLERLHRGSTGTVCNQLAQEISEWGTREMLPRDHHEHNIVANEVLPYIILQKASKFQRKVFSSVPGLGLLETARAVGNKAYKALKGTLGEERTNAARWLARHLITHNCALAQGIVVELYSFDEFVVMQTFESDKLVPLLADKMRST
jgi:hypothetical protein